jgi:hypothetical protein
MKTLGGVAFAVALGATVAAQQVPELSRRESDRVAVERQMVAGARPRGVMEMRVTKDAPYSAEAVTEFQQVLGDGNRITKRSVTKVFRDREGRTRRENTVIDSAGHDGISITLADPVAGTSWVLDPSTRTAYKGSPMVGFAVAGARAAQAEAVTEKMRREEAATARIELSETSREMSGTLKAALERAVSGAGSTTTEDLGQSPIEGVLAKGTKTTTVIAAGAIGNEHPITITSEQWFSPELQVLVMTRHSDPRTGDTTYRLTNLARGEPDRALFEVPADYTIRSVQEHVLLATPRDK